MKFCSLLMIFFLSGCISFSSDIEINAAKPWEGRYESKKTAADAIDKMELDKKESVWILSSSTMERLLKTMKE